MQRFRKLLWMLMHPQAHQTRRRWTLAFPMEQGEARVRARVRVLAGRVLDVKGTRRLVLGFALLCRIFRASPSCGMPRA